MARQSHYRSAYRARKDELAEMEKDPHEVVGYVSNSSEAEDKVDAQDHCSICKHYIDPNRCEHVQSPIAPSGWCVRYADSDTGEAHFGVVTLNPIKE